MWLQPVRLSRPRPHIAALWCSSMGSTCAQVAEFLWILTRSELLVIKYSEGEKKRRRATSHEVDQAAAHHAHVLPASPPLCICLLFTAEFSFFSALVLLSCMALGVDRPTRVGVTVAAPWQGRCCSAYACKLEHACLWSEGDWRKRARSELHDSPTRQ